MAQETPLLAPRVSPLGPRVSSFSPKSLASMRRAWASDVTYEAACGSKTHRYSRAGMVGPKSDPSLAESEAPLAEVEGSQGSSARALTKQLGLSLRDAGELLGGSQESVRQWVEGSLHAPAGAWGRRSPRRRHVASA
jgi:hypothetical protein